MPMLAALVCGVIFGAGLAVSRMIDPQKILNFLDVAAIRTGRWDPTLLTVFAGALAVMLAAYRFQKRLGKPLLEAGFAIPARRDIDAPLVIGSVLFGIGWGLAGICPGPAVAMLGAAPAETGNLIAFLAALLSGVALAMVWKRAAADG